ncbi:hypothetical protein N8T08_009329 [Aspergillus melleus]|uniref:Uncharacterized protein n=1 Tax=Aspergillus melleus TaxID=138277 RepID=A0ACC3AU82_9EURO|nr:hypothetical protein N8T08_009329 [Aspergillus melleus]
MPAVAFPKTAADRRPLADVKVLEMILTASKRTVDLDIGKPDDMDRLHELLADIDIFVRGFRYGSLERRGLELLRMLKRAAKRNKGIIYVDENAYGPDGSFAERPGWQQIGDAASGSSYIMGRAQGFPDNKERAVKGGSYHATSPLVAADTIALEKEVGLYPLEVIHRTNEKFSFIPIMPDQFVPEIMIQVVNGDTLGTPDAARSVVKLGDAEATPTWATPAVPNCYHDRNITWL